MYLADPGATDALGARLARTLRQWPDGLVVALDGELGAGKTALTRATLVALGHDGRVGSPSYTLIEPYAVLDRGFHHLDLYRLGDAEELEYMGIRDYFSGENLCLIEWPERGKGILPEPDLEIHLETRGEGRSVVIRARSELGGHLLNELDVLGPAH